MNYKAMLLFSALVTASFNASATFIGTSNGDLYDHDVLTNTSTLIGNSGVIFDVVLSPKFSVHYRYRHWHGIACRLR